MLVYFLQCIFVWTFQHMLNYVITLTFLLICHFSLFSIFMFLRSNIKRARSAPPSKFFNSFHSSLWSLVGGTLALIRSSPKFFGRLKSVRGGLGKQSAKYWSWLTIDLQCLAWIVGIEGSLGSNFILKKKYLKKTFFSWGTLLKPFVVEYWLLFVGHSQWPFQDILLIKVFVLVQIFFYFYLTLLCKLWLLLALVKIAYYW